LIQKIASQFAISANLKQFVWLLEASLPVLFTIPVSHPTEYKGSCVVF